MIYMHILYIMPMQRAYHMFSSFGVPVFQRLYRPSYPEWAKEFVGYMTEAQRKAARARYQRHSLEICQCCGGSGLVVSEAVRARAKIGGNQSFVKSLRRGELSMSERGKLGGRPKGPTLVDLDAVDRGAGYVSREELAPESTNLRLDPRHPAA